MSEWVWYVALIAVGASWVVALVFTPIIERFNAPRLDRASIGMVMALFWGGIGLGAVYLGYGFLTADWSDDGVEPAAAVSAGRRCDPSYKGACLNPNAYDYDCASGSGNGPRWVAGPVRVVGDDEYGLDRDGDGWGCE